MNIGILILMIVGAVCRPTASHSQLRIRWGCRNSIITIYCAQLSGHDYLENLSQNPSWI